MGLIFPDKERDCKALNWVAEAALDFFEKNAEFNQYFRNVRVHVNFDRVESISDIGDLLLKTHFPDPDVIVTVSALLVLLNSSMLFRLSYNDEIVTGPEERKFAFSRVSCIFIFAVLSYFKTESAQKYVFCIPHRIRYLKLVAFLSRLNCDHFVQIKIGDVSRADEIKRKQALEKIATETLAVCLALEPHITLEPASLTDFFDVSGLLS